MTKYIWIDKNILNDENMGYAKDLEQKLSIEILRCKTINEAINLMKNFDFLETKVIVSGRLYLDFVTSFKENLINMRIAPKIIIFTSNVDRFLERNKEYNNIDKTFYNSGGIATIYDEIENFFKSKDDNDDKNGPLFTTQALDRQIPRIDSSLSLISNNETKSSNLLDELELVFEYIDKKEKLILPLFFKSLIDNISSENLENYTNLIYNTYSEKSDLIKELLDPIISLKNIPIEILAKYYARLYTLPTDFHRNLNKDLRSNQKDKYLPFIKTLYEGVKLKSFPLSRDEKLYRGSKLSKEEMEN